LTVAQIHEFCKSCDGRGKFTTLTIHNTGKIADRTLSFLHPHSPGEVTP